MFGCVLANAQSGNGCGCGNTCMRAVAVAAVVAVACVATGSCCCSCCCNVTADAAVGAGSAQSQHVANRLSPARPPFKPSVNCIQINGPAPLPPARCHLPHAPWQKGLANEWRQLSSVLRNLCGARELCALAHLHGNVAATVAST